MRRTAISITSYLMGCLLSLCFTACARTHAPLNATTVVHTQQSSDANLTQTTNTDISPTPLLPEQTTEIPFHIPDPEDPFENVNRAVFRFNDALDRAALKPLAKAYNQVLPKGMRTSITYFFSNIADVYTMINNYLQGKITAGSEDLMRISINSFFGVLGLFDVATPAGLPKHQQDFGQTLGHYGISAGPYLVLPLLGPSTVRDTAGFVMDLVADPSSYIRSVRLRNQLYTLRFLNTRASYLEVTSLINRVSLDKYISVRNAYLQRRNYLIHGNTQALPDYGDEDEDEDDAPSTSLAPAEEHVPAAHILPPSSFPGLRIR